MEGCLKVSMERKFGARGEDLILELILVWSQKNFNVERENGHTFLLKIILSALKMIEETCK